MQFPEEWTRSQTIPLPKKGNLGQFENYKKLCNSQYPLKKDDAKSHPHKKKRNIGGRTLSRIQTTQVEQPTILLLGVVTEYRKLRL